VLTIPDFNKFFQVDCDVSLLAIGAVLIKEGRWITSFCEKLDEA
jgi:hypothetical protein